MTMIRVIVNGALGKMGRATCDAVMADDGMELVGVVDPAFGAPEAGGHGLEGVPCFPALVDCLSQTQPDVAVDFTTPAAVFDNITVCLEAGVHCVVGTTGLDDGQLARLEPLVRSSGANCFIAPNFAIGAVLMMEVSRAIIRHLPQCEIIELHHDQKLDAPSGTALRTADLLAEARDEAAAEQPGASGAAAVPPGPEGHPARGMIHKGIPIHSIRLPGLVAHQEVLFGGKGQTLSVRHDSISRESFMPGVVLAVRQVAFIDGLVIGLEKLM